MSTDVRTDEVEDRRHRLTKLIDNLQASIPAEDARHGEWFHFARGWAKLTLMAHEPENTIKGEAGQSFKNLQNQVDAAFTSWLVRRCAGLINLPPVPPVMLHHLPRFLTLCRRYPEH